MKFLINRRITITMLFIACCVLGMISYRQLRLELLPNSEMPSVSVQITTETDADPAYIESQAVLSVEGAIKSVGGIEDINTNINSRGARIRVSFKENVNMKYVTSRLQNKMKEVASDLPQGFKINVQKNSSTRVSDSFIVLQVRGWGGTDRVRSVVDDKIKTELENIDGIASVGVYGGRERAIEVRYDKEACRAINLTSSSIVNLLTANNRERSFLGNSESYGKKYFVHAEAKYTSPSDMENIVVAKGPVYLKDVAEIFYDLKDETTYNRVNGKDAIAVALNNESAGNIIEISDRVDKVVERLNRELAYLDVEIAEQSNTARTMKKSLDQISWLALVGGLFAVIILWIFLRNIRLVVIIALSIPISVITAFNLFYAFGVTINSLTLVGMALAIGMLLDNSIVVLENIYRLHAAGASAEESVMKGTSEVVRPILASTLTTVTVFLPFVFADNMIIKLIGNQIGVSIISTLIISLVVALLFIPMATYVILKFSKGGQSFYKKISPDQRPVQVYIVLLKMAIRNSFGVFVSAVVILFLVIGLVTLNNKQSLKTPESDRVLVQLIMNQGADLESTDVLVRSLETKLEDLQEKKEIICYVAEESATITVVLQDKFKKIANRDIQAIMGDIRDRCRINVRGTFINIGTATSNDAGSSEVMRGLSRMMRMMGMGISNNSIAITGDDYSLMQLVGEDLEYNISEREYVSWCRLQNYSGNRPEVHITPDNLLLNSYDISRQNISQGLASLNNTSNSGTTLMIDGEEYGIVVKERVPEGVTDEQLLAYEQKKGFDDLQQVPVKDAAGGIHHLSDISSVKRAFGSPHIVRENGSKLMTLSYSFNTSDDAPKELVESYQQEIVDYLSSYPLPPGVAIEVKEREDPFASFRFLMLAAFLLIFMILASVFESVITPFVLLFTIPLAAIGSLLAIYMTDNSLTNANTLIGMLILLGVVVNNGIILIDYANLLRQGGDRINTALIKSGLSRLRPILITSITTIVALLPMAFGKSDYSGLIGAPFAITVIGGLITSSLLTLVIIPTVYLGLESTLRWYRTLSVRIKLLHLAIYVSVVILIWLKIDSVLYQTMSLVGVTIMIPGITFFMKKSLRQANSRLISKDEPIVINIKNLVKIYERPSRFTREWESGNNRYNKGGLKKLGIRNIANKSFYFTIPALVYLYKDESLAWLLTASVISVMVFFIKRSSAYIYDNDIEIVKIDGRFGKLKRIYYGLVTSVPYIGKRKKPFKALKGVSMQISNGMFGLLGPNGAGKSTLIRTISGILEQSYGKIFINEYDTAIYREELQGLIGYLPQEFGTYENMSARDFLNYQAMLKGISNSEEREQRLDYVLKSVHMYERQHDKIGSFSGGMKQRIGIALILLHLPRILIVDEPTAGLDPRERIRFRNLLVELSKECIVIFSTHIIEDISSSCNQVAIVNKGELKYFGTPPDMLRFADNLVWQFPISPEEFEAKLDPQYVVLHIQDGDSIQVRYISPVSPYEGAVRVEPNLEDAYLCLLKNMKSCECEINEEVLV